MKMKKIKEIIKPVHIVYFIAVLVIVSIMQTNYGDDIGIKDGVKQYSNVISWVIFRYNSWSARFLQEATGYFLLRYTFLWKIFHIIILYMMPFLMAKIVGFEQKELPYAIFAVMAYPITHMASAGWVCTNITYYWPVFFALVYFVFLKKYMHQEKLSVWIYILMFVALIAACNHELLAVFMATVIVYNVIHYFVTYKKCPVILFVHVLLCALNILLIMTAPGNAERKAVETSVRFQQFDSFSVFQKMYLGLVRVYSVLVEEQNIIFMILCITMAAAGFLFLDKAYKKIIAVLPLTLLVLMNSVFTFYRLGQIMDVDLSNKQSYIPVLLSGVFVICMIMTMYYLFAKDDKYLCGLMIVCFLVGIATTGVMGFSPTIYASAERTSVFMLFSFLYLILLLFKKIITSSRVSENGRIQLGNVMAGLAVVMYLSNLLLVFLMHHSTYFVIK